MTSLYTILTYYSLYTESPSESESLKVIRNEETVTSK